MKKYISFMLALLLLLPGCGKKKDETTSQDAETIVRVMLGDLAESGETDSLTWYLEPQDVESYLIDFYKLDGLRLQDGAIVRIEGARAFELAVLQIDGEDIDRTAEALQNYLLDRQGSFTGYFPDQAALAEQGLVLIKGDWAALIVCEDPETAQRDFEECFGDGLYAKGKIDFLPDYAPEDLRPDGRLVYVDPGKDDMTVFDNSAILDAWKNGDDSALSKEDKAVLDAAKAVFDQCITPDMTGYNKELALYVWLTTHVSYDQSHYSRKGAPRTSYEPYGPLIKGTGVCLGYAAAFQLFMDMADIECITVTGAAFHNRENHAWNMVKMSGEWYCVDATWDHINVDQDYPAEELLPLYNYFNVTSDWMAGTDHQWDYDSVPEAVAEDYGRP